MKSCKYYFDTEAKQNYVDLQNFGGKAISKCSFRFTSNYNC